MRSGQLIAAMNVFARLAQNPRFMEYLQAPTLPQQTRQVIEPVEPVEAQAQVPCVSQQGREHSHVAESVGAPKLVPSVHEQVVTRPIPQVMPVQPTTFQGLNAGLYG